MKGNSSDKLIIFIKNPIVGKVKTRIAAGSDDDQALIIYKKLLKITRKITTTLNVDKYLFYSDAISLDDDWDNNKYIKKKQADGDLGHRMFHAFQTCFSSQANFDSKVLIIGSDCPYITPALIENAFSALDDHDVVIGPTKDGGYYLLGMKKLHQALFYGVNWSSDTVFNTTLEKIKNNGLSYTQTTLLNDIDTYEDWVEFQMSGRQ
ncbi:MAG: TIGR04282 family arsenosugar biosynthesis glycosyltransferase [Saprospiraceae bacterium]|nr:TIGR04282 family arsenosugar biosynthesis glycosyltransferase [Saprospiraceae bacterium]